MTELDLPEDGGDPPEGRSRGERGFVLVWMGLLLITLLAVAGFAVDLSNWWLQSERLQRAVDAGAHAGAVFLPGNVPQAQAHARREAARNGYNDGILAGDVNATITATQQANPYQLRVEGTTEVQNFFIRLLGFDSLTVTRDAVGEFEVPVPMGSPENKLGNDPEEGDVGSQFWINVAGPNSTKGSGDRFQSKVCNSSEGNCTGTRNPGINNDDYAFDGYFFTVDVKNVVPGEDLLVEVFDPAMTYVGDFCDSNRLPNDGQRAILAALAGNPYPDAVARFAPGAGLWCTGDQRINNGEDTQTTYLVRSPDSTPWSVTDNPVVDTATCSPQRMPSFPTNTNSSNANHIYQRLLAGANDPRDPLDGTWYFSEVFRQWVTICRIPAGSVQTGEYLLQIRSNANAADPEAYDSSITERGHNRLSLRAGFGTTGVRDLGGGDVTIAARSKLPIYANATGANTNFHLARILPSDAGRTLRVTLWDMGDAAQAGTLRIAAPDESSVSFTDCTFHRDNGGSLNVSSNCQLNNVSSANGFNARLVDVDVPIPVDYDCDDTSPTGCWTKVYASFPGGVNDTTTWSASVLGSPVRLVE